MRSAEEGICEREELAAEQFAADESCDSEEAGREQCQAAGFRRGSVSTTRVAQCEIGRPMSVAQGTDRHGYTS